MEEWLNQRHKVNPATHPAIEGSHIPNP